MSKLSQTKQSDHIHTEEDYQSKEGFEMPPSDGEFGSDNEEIRQDRLSKNDLSREIFEKKSKEQSNQISELLEYRSLCEKRIKQLMPAHPLPVQNSHLNSNQIQDKVYSNLDLENHNLKKDIQNLKNILSNKDEEVRQLKQKLDNYSVKINQIVNETVPKASVHKKTGSQTTFPNFEQIPSDKLKEYYNKLLQNYNNHNSERENILEALRKETVMNEEQRNYIEILKQTLEKKFDSNTNYFLNSQKDRYYNKEATNVEVFIDFSRLKAETEKARKELVHHNVLLNEINQELETYKKLYEDSNIKNQKLRESFADQSKENQGLNDRIAELEKENFELSDELNVIRQENERLIKDFDSSILKIKKNEREINDLSSQISELKGIINDLTFSKNKLSEYKKNYEKLKDLHESLTSEKNKLDEDYQKLNINYQNKIEEVKKVKENLNKNTERLDEEIKGSNYELNVKEKTIKRLEKQIEDLNHIIKDTNETVLNQKEKIYNLENTIKLLKNEKLDVVNQLDRFRLESENKNLNFEKSIKENQTANKELKFINDTLISEKKDLVEKLDKSKEEIKVLIIEKDRTALSLDSSEKNSFNLQNKIDELIYSLRQSDHEKILLKTDREDLSKEILNQKEKYEKELTSRINENKNLSNEINNFKIEIIGLKDKLAKSRDEVTSITNDLNNLNKINDEKSSLIDSQNFEINQLSHKIKETESNFEKLKIDMEGLKGYSREIKDSLDKQSQENQFYQCEINERNQFISEQKEELQRLMKNLNELNEENKLNIIKKDELNNIVRELSYKNENLENLKRKLNDDISFLQNRENELSIKLSNLEKKINENNYYLKACISNIKNQIYPTNKKSKLYELLPKLCVEGELKFQENILVIEEIYKNSLRELNELYQVFNDTNERLRISNQTNENIEKKLNLILKEKNNSEKELESEIKQISNQNKIQTKENEELIYLNEKLNQQYNELSKNFEKIKEEFNNERSKNEEMIYLIKEIKDENFKLIEENETIIYKEKALEERMILILDEKKRYEHILNKISNTYQNREMSKTISKLLSSLEESYYNQREKIKIVQRLNYINSDNTFRSNEELERLRLDLNETERKIISSDYMVEQLEKDLAKIDLAETEKNLMVKNKLENLNKLSFENQDLKEELRRYKSGIQSRGKQNENFLNESKSLQTSNGHFNYNYRTKAGSRSESLEKQNNFKGHSPMKPNNSNFNHDMNLNSSIQLIHHLDEKYSRTNLSQNNFDNFLYDTKYIITENSNDISENDQKNRKGKFNTNNISQKQ